MVKKLLLLILFVNVSQVFLNAQAISARAYTDKNVYEVGDYINYRIEIIHNLDLKVFKPALNEFTSDIEVLQSDEPIVEEADGSKKIIYRFIISKYDSAEVSVPQIPVKYQIGSDTTSIFVSTNAVQFSVRTLQVDTASEIKDVKPPITIPLDLLIIIIIISLIVIILLLGSYFYRKHQKKKKRQATRKRVYIIPPHVKALSELHALEEKKLWQQGMIKEYHSDITEIIRRYFEDRFKILALESSTSEIMDQLTRVVLPESIYQTVGQFLSNADLVKFAKYKPMPVVNEEMMKQALNIVENTVLVQQENLNKEKAIV
jgi:hypothetical protein